MALSFLKGGFPFQIVFAPSPLEPGKARLLLEQFLPIFGDRLPVWPDAHWEKEQSRRNQSR
jgi:hypothetical protein